MNRILRAVLLAAIALAARPAAATINGNAINPNTQITISSVTIRGASAGFKFVAPANGFGDFDSANGNSGIRTLDNGTVTGYFYHPKSQTYNIIGDRNGNTVATFKDGGGVSIGTTALTAGNNFQVGGGTFAVTTTGHPTTTGTVPTIDATASFTGATITAGSNDMRGEVFTNGGSSVTIVMANLGGGMATNAGNTTASPICTAVNTAISNGVRTYTGGNASTIKLTMIAATSTSQYLWYVCSW